MRVLHILPTVDPMAGGPVESVRRVAEEFLRRGHEVEVVTLDDPLSAKAWEFPVPVHATGPSRGKYGFNRNLIPWLAANVHRYDHFVIEGLWQFHGLAAWKVLRKARRRYVVFVHGMLDPWFKKTYPLKHLKKWLYWPWGDYRVLRDATAVLYTTETERLLARKSFWLYRAMERVISFGTAEPPQDGERLREIFLTRHQELRGHRNLLFLGRIHPKKGCDMLVRAFAEVFKAHPDYRLVMAGPDTEGWKVELEQLAKDLGVEKHISWPGMLEGDLKWGAFYAAEAFVLPSHQENFGIAVAEALGCGRPVLITDKVNTHVQVSSARAGFVGSATAESVKSLLESWVRLTDQQRREVAKEAHPLFATRFSIKALANDLLKLHGETGEIRGKR